MVVIINGGLSACQVVDKKKSSIKRTFSDSHRLQTPRVAEKRCGHRGISNTCENSSKRPSATRVVGNTPATYALWR